MVNKFKGRLGAKLLAAFILFTACALVLGSLGGILLFERYGLYTGDPASTSETLYGMALDKYSVQAMAAYFGKADLPPESFHYGIYQGKLTAEELKDAAPLAGTAPEDLDENARIHTFFVSRYSTYTLAGSILDTAYVHQDNQYTGRKNLTYVIRIEGSDHLYLADDGYGLFPLPESFWSKTTVTGDTDKGAAEKVAPAETGAAEKVAASAETVSAEAGTAAEDVAVRDAVAEDAAAEDAAKDAAPETAAAEDAATEDAPAETAVAEDAAKDAPAETAAAEDAAKDAAPEIYTTESNVAETDTSDPVASAVPQEISYAITDSDGYVYSLTEFAPPQTDTGFPAMEADRVNVISLKEARIFSVQKTAPVSGLYFGSGIFEATQNDDNSAVYTVASTFSHEPDLKAGLKGADLFVQADYLTRYAGMLRYPVLALLPICGIIGLLAFIFLMASAGHRDGGNAVVLRSIDRLPLDLTTVLIFCVCYVGLLPVYLALSREFSLVVCLAMGALSFALLYAAGLWYLMTLAVNLKEGGWWQRTLLRRVLGFFRETLGRARVLTANVKMRNRFWLLAGLLSLGEFFALVQFCDYYLDYALILWAIEKAVLFVLFFNGLTQFGILKSAAAHIAAGDLDHKVETSRMMVDFAEHGEALNSIGQGLSEAVGERLKSERMKTELITNVSHDIKTPLTSILNYTDLLTRLDLQDPTAREYLEVLSRQSIRLKKLLEDLIEASKASSGNLSLEMETLDASMLLTQAAGEFEDRLKNKNIDLRVTSTAESALVRADSRYLWRVFDNLLTNICKYAQPGTRAYVDLACRDGNVEIVFRNISAQPLNITSEELLERFTRGDSSRNTEGSGLGLSIATSLMDLMGGRLDLVVDGDLFKVTLSLRR